MKLSFTIFSLGTFKRIMDENFPELYLAKTLAGCCNTCTKLETSIPDAKSQLEVLRKIMKNDHKIK